MLIPLIVLVALVFLASLLYLYITNPISDRHVQKFKRPNDNKEVSCSEPPSEVFTKEVHIKLNATADQVVGIAKASGGLQFDAEKMVRELPQDVRAFEVIDYRICEKYGNGILTEAEYKVILNKILPELRETKNRISEMNQTPTQDGRIGIWVARIRGDDDKYSAQRVLVQKLEFYLGKEPALKNLMEVRELLQEVTGTTESERETLARQLAKGVNATMVIWGEIAALLTKGEFFPRITIGSTIKGIDSPIRLEPITEMSLAAEYQTPQPYTLRTAPERIREPIRLARYVVAIQHYKSEQWSQAADHFEALIQGGPPQNIHDRDVHVFAGHSNFYLHLSKNDKDSLSKARIHFESAKQSYENSEKDSGYPFVLNDLGMVYVFLNAAGIDTKSLFTETESLFKEASQLWKDSGDEKGFKAAQFNLAATYGVMASLGVNPEQNTQRAIDILEPQSNVLKEQGKIDSSLENNLGTLYKAKARTRKGGVIAKKELEKALEHFSNATKENKTHSPSGTYVSGTNGLAATFFEFIRLGVDIKENLSNCITAWSEVADIYQENKWWEQYADVQHSIARAYANAAQKGVAFSENMTKAIPPMKLAAKHYSEIPQWSKYAVAKSELAGLYERLYRHDIDTLANLDNMTRTLYEGIDKLQKHGLKDHENKFKALLNALNKDIDTTVDRIVKRNIKGLKAKASELLKSPDVQIVGAGLLQEGKFSVPPASVKENANESTAGNLFVMYDIESISADRGVILRLRLESRDSKWQIIKSFYDKRVQMKLPPVGEPVDYGLKLVGDNFETPPVHFKFVVLVQYGPDHVILGTAVSLPKAET